VSVGLDDTTRRERSDELHQRVRRFMEVTSPEGPAPTAIFDQIACDIARFQLDTCAPFARLARARGVVGAALATEAEIPAVPTDVFKLTRVATHPPAEDVRVFRTSGTTVGRDQRGEHAFRDLATYRLGASLHGRRLLCPDGASPHDTMVCVLGPSPELVGDSSLGYMCGLFGEIFGSSTRYYLHDDRLDRASFAADVATARETGARLLVLGTSFAFVHLLDDLRGERIVLPADSRVMQTGGFKGKSRVVEAPELLAGMAQAFALDPRRIVSEYGMTELSSQAYETSLRDLLLSAEANEKNTISDRYRQNRRIQVPPPWMRVIAVDELALRPVPQGEVGLARIVDLANVDSAVVIQTQDRIRVAEDGVSFELLGRAVGAPPRGCSLATEEMLGG
jgi:acyl-CoA synthetase (AMP-forming)/AMP-acid ligase II